MSLLLIKMSIHALDSTEKTGLTTWANAMVPKSHKFKSVSPILPLKLKLSRFSQPVSKSVTDHASATKSSPEAHNGITKDHSDLRVTSHAALDSMDLDQIRVKSEPSTASMLTLIAMMDNKLDSD